MHVRIKRCTNDKFKGTVTRPTIIKGRLRLYGTLLLYMGAGQCTIKCAYVDSSVIY